MYRPPAGHGYYDDYEDQPDQALVEEFDPNFQPDDDEIKMYAVEVLGMELPQDQIFMYLAKEALKKPLPDSWQAFQTPNGDVYYKHKVTQQKTTEHPIDVEYRRLYQQEKDKAARRTLKSKTSKPAGLAAMKLLGSIAKGQQYSGQQSNFSSQLEPRGTSNITEVDEDAADDIRREYEDKIKKYESSLEKDYDEWKRKEERQWLDLEKRLKQQHQDELDRINRNFNMPMSFDDRLKQQKAAYKKQFEEQNDTTLKRELKEEESRIRKESERAERDFQQQWRSKISQIESRNTQKLQSRINLLERLKDDLVREQQDAEKRRKTQEQRAQQQYEMNKEKFDVQAQKQLSQQLSKIQRQTLEKIRDKEKQLQTQYHRIRKMLKSSPEDRIRELIERKSRLQQIYDTKLQTYKATEFQLAEHNRKTKQLKQQQLLKQKLQSKFEQELSILAKQEEQKLNKHVEQLRGENQRQLASKEKAIFESYKDRLADYELNQNKKMIGLRQNFIQEIEQKKMEMDREHSYQTLQIRLQEKQYQLSNRQKMLKVIREDLKESESRLKRMELDRKLYRAKPEEVTELLKNHLAQLRGQPRMAENVTLHKSNEKQGRVVQPKLPSVFDQYVSRTEEMKRQLVADKTILNRILQHIQSTSMLPFYEKRKVINSDLPSDVQARKLQSISSGKQELIRRYNADVHKVREAEKQLDQIQRLLKRAQADQESTLLELRTAKFTYDRPKLTEELQEGGDVQRYIDQLKSQPNIMSPDFVTTRRVQDIFDDHSRFLQNIKQQLNNKLWEIRSMPMNFTTRRY